MTDINKRLREIAYKKNKTPQDPLTPKSEDVVFFICEEVKPEDFPAPFFNQKQIINLYGGVKVLTYCGKDQQKNINKNAIVIQEKLRKGDKLIYRCYLMDKDKKFNIRSLFLKYSRSPSIRENNYSLRMSDYIDKIKEEYTKEELIYILNKISTELTEDSL